MACFTIPKRVNGLREQVFTFSLERDWATERVPGMTRIEWFTDG